MKTCIYCQKCNDGFSKMETNFKEDSLEGVYSAIWGVRDTTTIRIKKDKLNWNIFSQDGELGIFEEVFPFVNPVEHNIYPKPIIVIKPKERKSNTIDVLFVEKFADLAKKQNNDFKKKKEWIKSLKQQGKLNISLFGNQVWTIDKIKEVMKKYDLYYNEKKIEYFEDKNRGKKWQIDFNIKIDKQTLRVPAKIAFNYFAYCTKQCNMINILTNSDFDKARNFIKGEFNNEEKIPIEIVKKSILYDEKDSQKRRILHILTFRKENDLVVSEITLFGFFTYKIILGKYPFTIQSNNFGCATAFDPFSKNIINDIYSTPQPIVGKAKYGLFCR